MPQRVAAYCSMLYAACCSVLQRIAAFCSVLQRLAASCSYFSVLQHADMAPSGLVLVANEICYICE